MDSPFVHNIDETFKNLNVGLEESQLVDFCTQYPEVDELFNKVLNNQKNLLHLCRCIYAFQRHDLEIPPKLLQTLNKLDNAGLLMEEFIPFSVTEALILQQLKRRGFLL